MQTWTFSTHQLPIERRFEAWQQALQRLNLPVGKLDADQEFFGDISCLTSPLGIEFARVTSSAQEIAGQFPKQASAIWLAVLVDGEATLFDDSGSRDINVGDILYGATGMPARLVFSLPFTQLFIKVPHLAISPRLLAPLAMSLGHLRADRGVNLMFSSLLTALSISINDLRHDQLRPIELSLTEFILTCLTDDGDSPVIGCGDKARSMRLHSICQTIETLLDDGNLNPLKVAEMHGVSLRYLQKMFTYNDNTFTNYVRTRRLERCRSDLISPIYAQMSVTEICFRWGFNGSPHFSRSFKAKYGVSPREYRQQMQLAE